MSHRSVFPSELHKAFFRHVRISQLQFFTLLNHEDLPFCPSARFSIVSRRVPVGYVPSCYRKSGLPKDVYHIRKVQ